MTPQQAHALKLKMSLFAEASAMIEHAKKQGTASLDMALSARDRVRIELYEFIDELTTEK